MHMKSVLLEFPYICGINFKNCIKTPQTENLNFKIEKGKQNAPDRVNGRMKKNLIVNSPQLKPSGWNLLSILESMTV